MNVILPRSPRNQLHRLVVSSLSLLALACPWAANAEMPSFQEVYDLVRSNLAGASEATVNQSAVRGLLQQFPGRVLLVTNTPPAGVATNEPALASVRTFERAFGYVRVARVEPGLAGAIGAELARWSSSNHFDGLVLDLRFARGEDFAEAARVADLLVTEARPLIDWGQGVVSATAKTNAVPGAVAVLVNGRTAGAAEAIAAALRQAETAILIGSHTAGEAAIFKEFPLTTGDRLRVATGAVRVGDGLALSPEGVTPDIGVEVGVADEMAYLADPYRSVGLAGTNRVGRLTEAGLVKMRREGLDPDTAPVPVQATHLPVGPWVTDPVLARALDLLTGLAVVQPSRRH